jgi:hypothetical protein
MTYYSRQQSRQKRKQLNADLVRRIKANEEAAIIDLLDIFEQKIGGLLQSPFGIHIMVRSGW